MSIRIPPIFHLYEYSKKGGDHMSNSQLSYLLHNMMTRSHTDYADLEYEAMVHETNANYSKSMDAHAPIRNMIQRLS